MTIYQVDVPSDLWERFKAITGKNKTMNDAIVELIEKEVEKHGT